MSNNNDFADYLAKGGVSGTYVGRYTDVCGMVHKVSLQLTESNGAITGTYEAQAAKGLPYTVEGEVLGSYQNRELALTVKVTGQPDFQMVAAIDDPGEYAEAAICGMALGVPGDFGGGCFMAHKGVGVSTPK